MLYTSANVKLCCAAFVLQIDAGYIHPNSDLTSQIHSHWTGNPRLYTFVKVERTIKVVALGFYFLMNFHSKLKMAIFTLDAVDYLKCSLVLSKHHIEFEIASQ